MVATAELEKTSDFESPIVETIPDAPTIPAHIEKGGVSTSSAPFTAQVQDDQGGDLIHTPDNSVTITLPSEPEALETLSKGQITSAATWFGLFWLRMIKKAAHLGWKVVKK